MKPISHEKLGQHVAHYGAVIVSAMFEIFFFGAQFGGVLGAALAIVAEAGKNWILWFLKNKRKAHVVVWVTYFLLVCVSLFATTFYSIALTYSNEAVNNAQSLEMVGNVYETVINGYLTNAQSSAENAGALNDSWISAKNGALANSDAGYNAALELAGELYEMQTNAGSERNPIVAFDIVAGKAGIETSTLIIFLMVLVGIMLELLIYSTEPWGEKDAVAEVDTTLKGYIAAMFDTPTNRAGLPSDDAISKFSGIPREDCAAYRDEMKRRGWLKTNAASRTTEATTTRNKMLEALK